MENTTNKNKIWWILLSIIFIFIIGSSIYLYRDSIKKYLGFATIFDYDEAANRALANDWKITSGSYAWGENIGWVDFAPVEGSTNVADNALWGYAYGENIGWISLNCGNTSSCDDITYKVSNNGEGKLFGYAWSENTGWIDFGTSTDIANRPWGVVINSAGDFTGYAYGENIGWISFNSANGGSVVYKVSTNWRPQSLRPQCNNGIDDDNDTKIDYPEDPQCSSLVDTRERSSGRTTIYTTDTSDDTDTSAVGGEDVATSTSIASTTATTTVSIQPISTSTITIGLPTTQPSVIIPGAEPVFVFTGTFTRDLYAGLSGADVKELQKFLNNNGFVVGTSGVGSVGNETTYYGNRTADAVTKLQEANLEVILKPYGLTKGTGYFGKSTRAFVNSKLSN